MLHGIMVAVECLLRFKKRPLIKTVIA